VPHETHARLDELAARCAIAPDYIDIFGRHHVTSPETKRAILSAMHVPADSDEDVRRALEEWDDARWRRPCEPVLVMTESGMPPRWPFRLPLEHGEADLRVRWEARNEDGHVSAAGEAGPGLPVTGTRDVDGARRVQVELPVPHDLPLGYYDLTATAHAPSTPAGTMRLIVVPPRCYLPRALESGARLWGLAIQLYGIRSARNWGAGDFGDLGQLIDWSGRTLGAGAIGLNPLHALRNTRPYHISPYSPDSRLFLNGLYIDIEAVPEFTTSRVVRKLMKEPGFRARLERARGAELVDYDRIYEAKLEALRACFSTFRRDELKRGSLNKARTPRGQEFLDFVKREGAALERYALFHALAAHLRREHPAATSWQEWPAPYRDPESSAVASFREQQADEVAFHQYVQWIAAEQLAAAARRAGEAGMPIGLYQDLALGNERGGADAWAFQHVLALNADCGAPPDAFAPEGQNWGLPPVNPHRLRDDGYRMYIDMVRRAVRHGGAVRMDHVMALFRLFWIPRGLPAAAGTYVAYPADELLGILALESVRHRTVIVGEDLGTVPDYVREKLGAWRVLSYRVSYFERRDDGEWKPPSAYPSQALAVVTTHDLATLAGFWAGEDIETRTKLQLYPDEAAIQAARADRRRDKERMIRALQSEGLLPPGTTESWLQHATLPRAIWLGVHAYLARTPSAMMLANLEDMLGERAQANLPGTVDEHPNWSRRTPLTLEELLEDARPRELAAVLSAARPRPPKD